jgi:TDG/mug DNA glycosylase family protein
METLPDIPPRRGGVLLVGINPSPISVAAGHYYQGKLGRRIWARLERVGLLREAVPGLEDEAFAHSGHGLTDIVKRPTSSAAELDPAEFDAGAEILRAKLLEWKPTLVLFAFREPAKRLLGHGVNPGRLDDIGEIPAFRLSGPYAPRADSLANEEELRRLLHALADVPR